MKRRVYIIYIHWSEDEHALLLITVPSVPSSRSSVLVRGSDFSHYILLCIYFFLLPSCEHGTGILDAKGNGNNRFNRSVFPGRLLTNDSPAYIPIHIYIFFFFYNTSSVGIYFYVFFFLH